MNIADRVLALSFFFFAAGLAALVSALLCFALGLDFPLCCFLAFLAVVLYLAADFLKFYGLRLKRREDYRRYFRGLDPPDQEQRRGRK